ncbi:F-box only protein 21 [Ceratobasidium sp. AG-Ba]|nr:F-box only protein 21 [Ceratobasidium sp. AG-Ba]QRW04732.1 F-box only protein 21 [Ceratobasidium sp. AG-Ba]
MVLKAFSGLMGVNTVEIGCNYDKLAKECGRQLAHNGVCVDPTDHEFDLEIFSRGVCDWMRSQGFGKAEGERYYDMMNHFPHTFMTTNRCTVPTSLVCTFVAIATRLGLCTGPVRFPDCIHAWIAFPSYEQSTTNILSRAKENNWQAEQPLRCLHVDVFHSDTEPFLSSQSMRRTFANFGVPEDKWGMCMIPTAASGILLQVLNNIMESDNTEPPPTTQIQTDARIATRYAMAIPVLITQPRGDNASTLVEVIESSVKDQFQLDTEIILSPIFEYIFEYWHKLGLDS